METRANYLLVASFVLGMVACTVGAAVWILGLHPFPETRAYYEIYFNGSVAGLKTGAPVFLSGIPIGNVRKVELDREDPSGVHVTIEVRKDAAIKSDSLATLEVDFIFGDASVGITAGSGSAPPLSVLPGHAYPIVASSASQLQSVAAWAADFVQRTIAVSDTLIEMLDDENRQAISETLQTMEQTTARAAKTQRVAGMIDWIGAAVHDLAADGDAFRAKLLELRGSIVTAESGIDEASAIVKQVDGWIRDFDKLVQGIRPEQARLIGALRDLDGTIRDARELVGHLTREVDDFERDPTHTLLGKPRGGYSPK